MNAINKRLVFLLLALCALLAACVPEFYAPDSGTWYCEELQAQFIADASHRYQLQDNSQEPGTYVIVDGDKIRCVIDLQRYSKHFAIVCQEADNEKYDLGEAIYELEVVSLSDSEYVLEDDDGKKYTFVRKD